SGVGGRTQPLVPSVSPRALLLAVRINSKGREVLYLAKGDSVKLGCPYVLEPEDNGPQGVGIEWIQITPERTGPENVFLSYHDHHVNYGSGSGLQDRVAFVQNDPGQHDASIRLADLQVSDTGTYQCRVKKNTVAVHEVIVTVQEKPATPQCWTEGELIEGSSILLRCYSRGGASPLAYQWAKLADGYGGGRLPHGTIQGRAPGDLLIHSLSEVHAGVYQCRVTNRVGYAVCQINLGLSPSKWHHGVERGDDTHARAERCRGLAPCAGPPPGARFWGRGTCRRGFPPSPARWVPLGGGGLVPRVTHTGTPRFGGLGEDFGGVLCSQGGKGRWAQSRSCGGDGAGGTPLLPRDAAGRSPPTSPPGATVSRGHGAPRVPPKPGSCSRCWPGAWGRGGAGRRSSQPGENLRAPGLMLSCSRSPLFQQPQHLDPL
uniref:V-set and immunoglobulin domain containing 8 n=1 Tax=Anser brachyrhynchus TaxID=132585 RepID=A0A8B9BY39_9AVES